MSSFSPLRYPGGKGRLATYLAEIVELNGLQKGHYVEPFAGGAGVALELLLREKVAHIHINDIDFSIYAFWKSAVYESDEFADRIMLLKGGRIFAMGAPKDVLREENLKEVFDVKVLLDENPASKKVRVTTVY